MLSGQQITHDYTHTYDFSNNKLWFSKEKTKILKIQLT